MKLLCSRATRAVSSHGERLMMPPTSQAIQNWWLEACSSWLTSASFLHTLHSDGRECSPSPPGSSSPPSILCSSTTFSMRLPPRTLLQTSTHSSQTRGAPLCFISASPSSAPCSLFIYCLPSTRLNTSRSLIFSSPP